ncbi:MAG: peptidoglycan D,D-transpeptidase FtsI family protein, partial [Dongiales bacterium]
PLGARPAPCSPRHADPVPPRRDEIVQLDGATKRALETGRARLLVGAALFALAFAAICGRLVDVTMLEDGIDPRTAEQPGLSAPVAERADIVDRNGVVLATSLATGSLFANPRQITNVDEAAKELAATIPGLSVAELKAKLAADKSFVWLQRDMTPQQQFAVNRLGIMGLYFQADERRVYPMGSLTAHVVGFTDVDAKGLAGIERSFDDVLAGGRHPVQLSLDVRIQQIMREELQRGIDDFNGIGGAGIVLDAQTGEILSLVSLPDFDPNLAATAGPDQRFNRATLGVYEMGSTFKTLNTAMALDSGKIKMTDTFDAAHNIQIGRFTIHDFEHMNRALSVPEVFMYSSNIGAARMAMVVGIDIQKAFMAKFGMLRPVSLELPELGKPQYPADWRPINSMTIAFGQGIAVSAVHVVSAVAAMVNGGLIRPATLIKRSPEEVSDGQRVISSNTSDKMRELLRLVVQAGTGKSADAPGYLVGGKTGTAQKQKGRGYEANARLASFVGAFPMSTPRYVVFVMVDEPKPNAHSYGFATGGWVAAPVVSRIVQRMAPMVGLPPIPKDSPEAQNALLTQVSVTNAAE